MPEWRPGLRPLAGAELEDAVEHVERLAHLLRVRVRAEVEDAAAVPLAREHHARVVVLDRDRDVRERLVVAQPHVERRPVPLDEVLLEVERLDLGAGDDHLEVGDPRDEVGDRRAGVAAAGLEVRADARPQRLRLADVEDLAPLVAEEVDARLRRKRLQLARNVCHDSYLSPLCSGLWGHFWRRSRSCLRHTRAVRRSRSAPPRTPSGRRRSSSPRRRMGLLRLAGFGAVRITSTWEPGLVAPTRARGRRARERRRRSRRSTACASTSPSTTPARGRRR